MIRISAGLYKGTRLQAPEHIRPTEARVRSALFNVLAQVVPKARVLDGFAGSGALGIEALSRGAGFAAFVEDDAQCIIAIRDNLQRLSPELERSRWRLVQGRLPEALRLLAGVESPFDLVLLDPPYRDFEPTKTLQGLVEYAIIATAGFLAIEHDRRTAMPQAAGPLRQIKQHRYGETVLSFYQAAA